MLRAALAHTNMCTESQFKLTQLSERSSGGIQRDFWQTNVSFALNLVIDSKAGKHSWAASVCGILLHICQFLFICFLPVDFSLSLWLHSTFLFPFEYFSFCHMSKNLQAGSSTGPQKLKILLH